MPGGSSSHQAPYNFYTHKVRRWPATILQFECIFVVKRFRKNRFKMARYGWQVNAIFHLKPNHKKNIKIIDYFC